MLKKRRKSHGGTFKWRPHYSDEESLFLWRCGSGVWLTGKPSSLVHIERHGQPDALDTVIIFAFFFICFSCSRSLSVCNRTISDGLLTVQGRIKAHNILAHHGSGVFQSKGRQPLDLPNHTDHTCRHSRLRQLGCGCAIMW